MIFKEEIKADCDWEKFPDENLFNPILKEKKDKFFVLLSINVPFHTGLGLSARFPGSFSLYFVENFLAHAKAFGRYFEKLVFGNVF